jgi:hypothetical protein
MSTGPGNQQLAPLGVFGQQAAAAALLGPYVQINAAAYHIVVPPAGATPRQPGKYLITYAGVCAITLDAPLAGADDGVLIEILSNTAHAHTVTSTGNFQDGAGHVNEATFAADAGAQLVAEAVQGKWNAKIVQGVTMS